MNCVIALNHLLNSICSKIQPNSTFRGKRGATLNICRAIHYAGVRDDRVYHVDCKVTTNGPASQPCRGDSVEMVYARSHRRFSFLPTLTPSTSSPPPREKERETTSRGNFARNS